MCFRFDELKLLTPFVGDFSFLPCDGFPKGIIVGDGETLTMDVERGRGNLLQVNTESSTRVSDGSVSHGDYES